MKKVHLIFVLVTNFLITPVRAKLADINITDIDTLAETMVGMAQGISTAARTSMRPLNSSTVFSSTTAVIPDLLSVGQKGARARQARWGVILAKPRRKRRDVKAPKG